MQLLEEGVSPQEACSRVVHRMKEFTPNDFEVGLVAMDTKVHAYTNNTQNTTHIDYLLNEVLFCTVKNSSVPFQ